MIYQATVSKVNDIMVLVENDNTQWIRIPADDQIDWSVSKEVCAGLGCIGLAATSMGHRTIASMEWNPCVADHLRRVACGEVLVGDINQDHDQARLHAAGGPIRGLLLSDFPCQPLSTQGDGKGAQDSRSLAFLSTLKVMWRQQMAAMILECVPKAEEASYVQKALQTLAWSMGMDLHQRVLHLHHSWPSFRTRWWCIMTFQRYQIDQFPDLPRVEPLPVVGDLLTTWPSWGDSIESQVLLTADELRIFGDARYGTDQRWLRADKPCPCLLHSYGSVLDKCPCGCRAHPLASYRLVRDGVRGFYVLSAETSQARYLTTKEAALFLTVPATIEFDSEKLGLSLLGQCAAPAQAVWTIAQLHRLLGLPCDPEGSLRWWLMATLRSFHASAPFPCAEPFTRIQLWGKQMECINQFSVHNGATIKDLKHAEQKLAGYGMKIQIMDSMGVLPDHALLQQSALGGDYMVIASEKAQRKKLEAQMIQVLIQGDEKQLQLEAPVGTHLFEIFQHLGIEVLPGSIQDADGQCWCGDERPLHDLIITRFQYRAYGLSAKIGLEHSFGLSDTCLDMVSRRILKGMAVSVVHWMPAAIATRWYEDGFDNRDIDHWLLSAFHGQLWTCMAVDAHWIFVAVKVEGQILHVKICDGTGASHPWAMHMAAIFKRILALPTCCLHRFVVYKQHFPFTCGTIALLHIGLLCGAWTVVDHPDELAWHCTLLRLYDGPSLCRAGALGDLSNEERDAVWRLRDILQSRGVPDALTEERALHGLSKIGLAKIQEALGSKDQWGQLKALGSAPKVNYLWIKPAELEAQIRKRAQQKFKIHPSSRKSTRAKSSGSQPTVVDPLDLKLIDNTFVTDDDETVTQLKMIEVGANRTGLAFGHLSDAQPFLQGTESLSLGGLGILTTTPIPVSAQGLLPVTDLRFPAIFVPTGEAILVEGSLIQLGDRTIHRVVENNAIKLEGTPTTVLKVTVFRDEWNGPWDKFVTSPVKAITHRFPNLLLCKGINCGDGCPKFHAPVDSDIDSVIADLWNRQWFSLRGRKMESLEADIFQVYIRVPQVCVAQLHWLSGQSGLYMEPRSPDGRSAESSTAIIWLPGASLADAQHKQKTTEKTLPVTRFGQKYGIRVMERDEAQVRIKLGVEESDPKIMVQQIYEMRPLPHCTQRKGVAQMLSEMGWAAKPVQPGRADATGMCWRVGAETPPPAPIVQTSTGDVTITLQKQVINESPIQRILSSSKTQAHIRRQTRVRGGGKGHKETEDKEQGEHPAVPQPRGNQLRSLAQGRPMAAICPEIFSGRGRCSHARRPQAGFD